MAQQAGMGLDVQNEAADLQLHAQRKGGELLSGMELDKGGDAKTRLLSGSTGVRLQDLGITRYESMTWQQIARIPEERFEQKIVEICAAVHSLEHRIGWTRG